MSQVTDYSRSTAEYLLGTVSNAEAIGGVAISSNGPAVAGYGLRATGSNSARWDDVFSFGSNATDIGTISSEPAAGIAIASNASSFHTHRGVGGLSAAGSNTQYGTLDFVAGSGIGITAGTGTITISSSNVIADGTYVEARNGGSEVVSTSTVATSHTIDLADGNWHDITLTADTTLAFTGATNGEGDSFVLALRQDGTGGWAVTWPGSVTWPGGDAPTLDTSASSVAFFTFLTRDGGTTWYGFVAGGGTSISSPSLASNSFSDVALTVDASMALTSPDSGTLSFSSPFFSEVVTDSDELVWEGSDVVHDLVRLY